MDGMTYPVRGVLNDETEINIGCARPRGLQGNLG